MSVRAGTAARRVRGLAGMASPPLLVERALGFFAADFRRQPGPVVVALSLAVAAAVRTVPEPLPLGPQAAIPLAVAATAPLAVVRRFPAPAIGLVLAANSLYLLFWRLTWPSPAVAAWLLALGAAPNVLPRRPAVAVAMAMGLVTLGTALVPVAANRTQWDGTLAEALAVLAAWGAGEMLRSRRQAAAELAASAARMRDLAERSAVARERASISRELHDVVAHHVSMIAVRAATARYEIGELPATGQAVLDEIAGEARTALAELRVILGLLRRPDRPGEAVPQPRITDLAELLARFRRAGTDVVLRVHGEPFPLAESVELCVYRIVQEAVTNTGRHAPGATAEVGLAYRSGEVSVQVRDRGPAGAPPPRVARGGEAAGGFGLVGMRERVTMLGGSFQAGPCPGGGFGVSACLPVSAKAVDEAKG
jgi:signal transduction histidine kinase